MSRSHGPKNRWFVSDFSKTTEPIAAIKCPRFALLISVISNCIFGEYEYCDYPCHCQNNAVCNLLDGSCPTGCDDGDLHDTNDYWYTGAWTGYGCQIGGCLHYIVKYCDHALGFRWFGVLFLLLVHVAHILYVKCTIIHPLRGRIINSLYFIGRGWPAVAYPFLGTGCPVPNFGNIYLVWNEQCIGCGFYIPPTDSLFE